MIFRFPLDFIGITQYFGANHRGIDLGWHNYQGEPVYAAADGTVSSMKDYDTSGQSWGNFVKISHGDGWYTLYAHLKDGICVSNGQQVKQGDIIGYMGNTGSSYGTHLHFEVYQGGASTSCRINPLITTYVFPEQQVSESCKNDVLYYNSNIPTYGTWFIVNDEAGLYLLDGDGNKIGLYNYGTDVIYQSMGYQKYGYQYYYVQINGDKKYGYMAKDFLSLKYPSNDTQPQPVPEPTPSDDEKIKELEEQIKELNDTIALKDKQIEELKNAITWSKCEYKIEEPNYYKIQMYKDETLCIKFAKDTMFEMQLSKDDIVKIK